MSGGTDSRRARSLAALAVAFVFVGSGSASAATAPTANLLVNPGAEAGPGSPDGVVVDAPPSWTTAGSFTATRYGAPGGFPTTAQSASIGGGSNFFAGGNTGLATATQTVDVFSATSQIDAGRASATLSGYLGGFSSQSDTMAVTATFLNAHTNGTSLGSLRIGPVTAADRGNQTQLLQRATSGAIPVGTRAIQVAMTATRLEGTSNDGYADNISLSLSTVAPPALGRAVNVALVSGRVLIKVRGRGFVPLGAGQQIPVGSLLDTTQGTVRLTSAVNTRGKVQSGDFSGGVFQVGQSRGGGGLTDLTLSGGSFRGCAVGAGRRAGASSSRVVRRLRGNARGRFRTRGRYSAATVRGTAWNVEDRCDGTLTKVTRGVVTVRDFRKRRNITVRAGRSYLARAG